MSTVWARVAACGDKPTNGTLSWLHCGKDPEGDVHWMREVFEAVDLGRRNVRAAFWIKSFRDAANVHCRRKLRFSRKYLRIGAKKLLKMDFVQREGGHRKFDVRAAEGLEAQVRGSA